MYPECGIMVFRGRSPRNSIIPHKGYNPYTLENHSTADLYYDATTQTLGCVSLPQSLYFTMQLGCIFIHPRVYEISRVHGFCTSCFSFEVWLHHSTKFYTSITSIAYDMYAVEPRCCPRAKCLQGITVFIHNLSIISVCS